MPDELGELDRRVFLVAGALFACLMALSPWYGFDRDELYFLDAAHHLQGGYVDQPVLAPLFAKVSLSLFGVSLPGLRLWPALAGFATVLVAAMIARELGGGRRAQLLAAIGTATMPALLAIDHLEGPTAFDVLSWSALALVALRVGRTGDPRWWLAGGLVLGVGLANKHSIGFFALALALGTLIFGGKPLVANRWFLWGALIAGLFTLPDLFWQAGHGWATIAMTRQLNADNGGLKNVGNWVAGQLLMTTLAFVFVWIVGLAALWRSRDPMRRALTFAYGLLFVFFCATTGAKIYYLAGAYPYLLAAGFVALDGWLVASRRRIAGLVSLAALSTAAALPLVLPVLPAADTQWVYGINQVPGESVGWPELVRTVNAVWRSLPSSKRGQAVIFTDNYGEAGAINELGRKEGMPLAYSDQNSEWWWGPGRLAPSLVVAVAPGPRDVTGYGLYLEQFFSTVRTAGRFTNTAGIHNQEWGGRVYLCSGLRERWPVIWRRLRHYD